MSELSDALAPLIDAERSATPARSQLDRRVARRRRRRRLRAAGGLVAVAVAIAGVSLLGSSGKRAVRITNPPSSSTSTTRPSARNAVTDTALGWSVVVPKGWTAQHSQSVCNDGEVGIVVSPDPHAFTASEDNAGCFEGSTPPRPGAVIVSLSRVAPASPLTPSTPLPLALADVPVTTSAPGLRNTQIIEGSDALLVRVVLPPDASAATRGLVDDVLRSLRPVAAATTTPKLVGAEAINLALPDVTGIAFDNAGNLYLADDELNRVLEVQAGVVVRVIGNGTQGFSGDGGPAADARLDYPRGVAVDDEGNVYIGDSFNNRIRRVTPDGTITTYAGTGASTSGADARAADGRAASETSLQEPSDMIWDTATASLYVAEGTRVRRIGRDGIVHTVAGTADGRIGFEEHPGGVATETAICDPSGVAISRDRSLWITESCDKHIARVAPDGRIRPAPGFAFRLAAAPDGSVTAYWGRGGGIDRVTPTADTPLLQLDNQAPASSCIHYSGNGSDAAALAWHGNTLYFANPSMGRVCARQADGTIDTVVGG